MELQLLRYSSQSKTTFGAVSIEKKFQCHSVEDRHRDTKIKHETRIPAGRYEIKLREFGGHYERYKQKYEGHEGMLWLQDVPEFSDILIHIGNGEKDTSGCILLCNEVNKNIVDKISIIKTMNTEAVNHDPAITFINTGNQQPGKPSMGAWLSYGLGSPNKDLPSYVVAYDKATGKRLWKQVRETDALRESPDAYNDIEHPERVTPKKVERTVKNGSVTLPPHSLMIVHVPAA